MTSIHSIGTMPIHVPPMSAAAAQRYTVPDSDYDIIEGMCYNCDHRVTVELDGTTYHLCVQERDDRKGGQLGDVHECDRDATECCDWAWSGSFEEWEDAYAVRPL